MVDISSQEQLEKIIKQQVEKIVNEIKLQIAALLYKHIEFDVYLYDYFPNKVYENGTRYPTYEFLQSWVWGDNRALIDGIYSILAQDINIMKPPTQDHPYRHGSWRTNGTIDRRKALADILNVHGSDEHNDWRGKMRNAYWDEFIKELDKNFDNWVKKAIEKYL